MNSETIIIAVIGWIIAVFGLVVAHWFTSRRDFANKKREIRTNYLAEAYRKLERGAMPPSKKYDRGDFESAIADIQLFGNPKQVKIAHQFAEKAAKGNGTNLQSLLEDLRADLRKELKISVEGIPPVKPFRIDGNNRS
jgi:hypothetical protein